MRPCLIRGISRLSSLFESWARTPCASICIEDYAIGAAQGAHYVGEIGGLARLSMLRAGVGFRMIGVKSAKKAMLDGLTVTSMSAGDQPDHFGRSDPTM